MKKEYMDTCVKICERAEKNGYRGERMTLMMDLESAVEAFNMEPKVLLESDDITFCHDINGIINNIVRDKFPATDFNHFVPRCTR